MRCEAGRDRALGNAVLATGSTDHDIGHALVTAPTHELIPGFVDVSVVVEDRITSAHALTSQDVDDPAAVVVSARLDTEDGRLFVQARKTEAGERCFSEE
jgi:hypothetical protein